MGCGSSSDREALVRPVEKDSTDQAVDHVEFEQTKIPVFDEFFWHAGTPMNSMIDMNNDLNDTIAALREAVALASGGLVARIRVGRCTDAVSIVVKTVDGRDVSVDTAVRLHSSGKLADLAMAQACYDLDRVLDDWPDELDFVDGQLTCGADNETVKSAVEQFNRALGAFKNALGNEIRADVRVRKAVTPGAPTCKLELLRSSPFKKKDEYGNETEEDDDDELHLVPAGRLELLKWRTGAETIAVEASVLAQIDALLNTAEGTEFQLEDPFLVSPIFQKKEDCSFDFDIQIQMNPDLCLPDFPEVLPYTQRLIYAGLLTVRDAHNTLAVNLPALKEEVLELKSQAQELVSRAPEEASNAGLSPADAFKAASATAANCKLVSSGVDIYTTVLRNLQSNADNFRQATSGMNRLVREAFEIDKQRSAKPAAA